MANFLIRFFIILGLGFAAFSYVDFATAALLAWWKFTFMWAVLLVGGMILAALWTLGSSGKKERTNLHSARSNL